MLPKLHLAWIAILLAAVPVFAGADGWLPIDLADPSLNAPAVERNADAEVIFWDVRLDDSKPLNLVLSHYVRLKIFTDRGRESQGKIDLSYADNVIVDQIAARTITPDGKFIELKPEDVFERTVVKLNGAKLKTKSFAIPGIVTGAIVEYRWREVHVGSFALYVRMPFQRELPARSVTYHFRPLTGFRTPIPMRLAYFHMPPIDLTAEPGFFFRSTMTNVPAFRSEPYMPPEDEVRHWMLVYYSRPVSINPDTYWPGASADAFESFKPHLKITDEVQKAASEAIGAATSPEEKLQRLFEFCREKIKNIDSGDSEMTAEERAERKENKTPADTLKRGEGSGFEINLLFTALAVAAGLDAHVALSPNRAANFFDRTFPNLYFLRLVLVAVKTGDTWRFFDPGAAYVPQDMLRWQEEGQTVLVLGPERPGLQRTPLSPPEKSKKIRTANLRLNDDGTLEGSARIEYTGHVAAEQRQQYKRESATQREQEIRDEFKKQMGTAELSDIQVENLNEVTKPLAVSFHVRAGGYASQTGKRMFIQPAFFQHGLNAIFTATERKQDLYFPYLWSEQDDVTIELPNGLNLDPANLQQTKPTVLGGASEFKSSITRGNDGRTINYTRSFVFGNGGMTYFLAYRYPEFKSYFDSIRQQDNYAIALARG
jgi:hypothetical protein